MAIKNYLINNKKKSVCIITALMMLIVVAFVVVYVNHANAGVFVEDEDGNKVQTNEIHVLEIVAEYGQQVLGYTVKGQEPISEDRITSYRGTMNIDIDDFKNATGYVLNKTAYSDGTFSYTVEESVLNETFNKNVLGDSMADGEIQVKVVQANELTLKDIEEAQLIYINSNDSNDNLLYYYDQFMRDAAEQKGYGPGDKGASYNDSYISVELKSAIAVKKISAAAGNKVLAAALTDADFILSGATDYQASCLSKYKETIAELDKEYFDGSNFDETLSNISTFLAEETEIVVEAAKQYIFDHAGATLSDDEKARIGDCLYTIGWSTYNKNNLERYCVYISGARTGITEAVLQSQINTINSTASNAAKDTLVSIKSGLQAGAGVSSHEYDTVQDCFRILLCNRKDVLISEYADEFLSSDFQFSNPSNTSTSLTELQDLVNNVNVKQQTKVLEELADAAGDAEKTADFVAFADTKFDIADIEGYNQYYIDDYITALEAITDVTIFRPDSSDDEGYDLEKIKTFISDINETAVKKKVTISYDLSWTAAMGIYEYAMFDDKGLMYNTELLTTNILGDYSQDLSDQISTGGDGDSSVVDNTNNMYKILLLMRQIQSAYYVNNIEALIDDVGVYYPGGVDANGNYIGTGVNSWYKETFGNDFSNYVKYHEPDVVGRTFNESGTEGAEKNYVHKRIYSFTGEQFFGGKNFVTVSAPSLGVVTQNTGYTDGYTCETGTGYVFVDASNISTQNLYAWVWPWNEAGAWVPLTPYNVENRIYQLAVPNGICGIIITSSPDWTQGKITMNDYYTPAEHDGLFLKIVNSTLVESASPGYVNITNIINNGTVQYSGNMYIDITYNNVTDFKYSIDGGASVDVASGDHINIGDDKAEESNTVVIFTYKMNGVTKTVRTTLYKKTPDDDGTKTNYLSVSTASNFTPLIRDNTWPSEAYILENGNKGDVVRYIMGVELNQYSFPLNILEIEPGASVTVLDNADGAKKLAEYLKIDIDPQEFNDAAKRQKYFNITYMSVKEFNTRNEDLTAEYDLIYIGIDSGYVIVRDYGSFYRTQYQDKSMNGLVYTGIGDKYGLTSFMRGVAADDYIEYSNITNPTHLQDVGYWKTYMFDGFTNNENPAWNLDINKDYVLKSMAGTTRLGGVDLTVRSKDKLIDYLKAGYPILLADEIMDCDDTSKYVAAQANGSDVNNVDIARTWRYVDVNSKMYAFVQEAKNLGKNAEVYDGLAADGNPVFLDGKTYPSLVSESNAAKGRNPENLKDENKLEGGLSYAIKRTDKVEFELVSCPTEYNKNADGTRLSGGSIGNTILSGSSEYSNYSFTLNIKTNVDAEWLEENYSYRLDIDKSGVGKFEEDYTNNFWPHAEYIEGEDGLQVVLSGAWPSNIEGFVPWRIIAYNNDNTEQKFSYTGFSAFESREGKKDVYVLWVRTEYPSNLNFNLNFTNSIRNHIDDITDYNIHVISMTYSQFVNMWPTADLNVPYTSDNSKLKVKSVAEYFNIVVRNPDYNYGMPMSGVVIDLDQLPEDSELNMLVFGFSDSYTNQDIKNINALKNIEYFINAGNSLLFTHDNSSYLSTMNYYGANGYFIYTLGATLSPNWARYTTTYMRAMLGMDLYGITYSSSNLPESAANARMYLSEDITQADLRGFTELCSFHYTSDNTVTWGDGNKLYAESASGQPHSNTIRYRLDRWAYTREVMKVNEGQITEYPYVLDELINVGDTHAQYMQIDMEDVETTVWFTLNNETKFFANSSSNAYYKYTKGDGANNYYIYSNGNITYTGSGHSIPSSSEEQLFINTVIAALKAGNYPPVVEFPYAVKVTEDSTVVNYVDYYRENPNSNGVVITFKPTNPNSREGVAGSFSHCRIYIDVDDSGDYSSGDILLNDSDSDGSVNTSNYIKDSNNTGYTIIQAENLINTGLHSFLITKEDVETIESIIGEGDKCIYEHKIFVEVTDNGTKKDANAKSTGKNSIKIREAEYIEPGYFNLN